MPPLWLQVIVSLGGVSGFIALLGSFIGFGKVLERVGSMKQDIAQLPTLISDVAYIKGRMDGRQEGLDEVTVRRTRKLATG